MSRRVATITLNPAYDLVGFCPEIERGEVNLVTNWNAILIFRVDFDSDACLFSDGQRKLRLSSHH